MTALQRERLWPWIGAIAIALLWWYADRPFPKVPDGLLSAAATVASVFASFLGVSKAIILTIKGTKTYKVLEQNHYTDQLFGYLRAGIYAAVVFASLSLIGFFIDSQEHQHIYRWFCTLWILSGSAALLTYVRIANILFKLLKQPEVTA